MDHCIEKENIRFFGLMKYAMGIVCVAKVEAET